MAAPDPDTSAPGLDRLHYGRAFAEALHGRLREHFARLDKADLPRPAPLTVGLFGGWGSGKTLHLECLRDRVLAEARLPEVAEGQRSAVTLPVFFNAWRHESEAHLIVPLLKTTHHTLNRWLAGQQTSGDKARDAVLSALNMTAIQFKDAALALAAGLSGKLNVPGLGEIEYSFGDMLAEDAKRQAARKPDDPARGWFKRIFDREQATPTGRLVDLDAIYHDFETHLKSLTGVERAEGVRLNLLFLVDDLDRCLPEKAVQMLESIKLFLDVPGCAFVLALDDEVVERGIAHRYRDYRHDEPAWDSVAYALHPKRFEAFRGERDHQAVGPANPVTGHEYLEKMVHLPVYVPQPAHEEVRSYLATHFRALFEPLPQIFKAALADAFLGKAPPELRDSNAAENATRAKLVTLIARAVPSNPRKLNRLAELYDFKLKVAAGGGWKPETERERLTLLRLAAVQLLSPELYRFGVRQTSFFAKLEQWLAEEKDKARVSGELERRNRDLRVQYRDKPVNLRQLERLDEPLLAHLRNAQTQRSGFDPFDLLDPDAPCEENLFDYFRLSRDLSLKAAAAATVVSQVASLFTAEQAALTNSREFLDQLLAADPLAWRNALAQEAAALAGRVLDDATFAQLEAGVLDNPEHVSLAWLEPLAPHLTPAQLHRLYQAGDLLRRLNAAVPDDDPPPEPTQ
jgi:hypothetical protein